MFQRNEGGANNWGEVELGFVPPNLTKTDFDRGSPEWAALEEVMTPFMAPIVKEFREAGGPRRGATAARSHQPLVTRHNAASLPDSQFDSHADSHGDRLRATESD